MRFKIVILLILLQCSSTIADVTIPFEFLYGRWVNGHYYHGWAELLKFENQKGDIEYFGNYEYTNNNHRLEINSIGNYLLYNSDSERNSTANFSYKWRPKDNWQLGLTDFSHVYWRDQFRLPRGYNTQGSVNSIWMNHNSLILSERHSAYSYQNDVFYPKGYLGLENSFEVRYNKNKPEYTHSVDEDIVKEFVLKNRLKYGLMQDAYTAFDFNVEYIIEENNSFSVNKNYYYKRREESTFLTPDYNLSFYLGFLKPVYLKTGVHNELYQSSIKEDSYSNFSDTLELYDSNSYKENLKSRIANYFTKFIFISNGEFNSSIILDDYNNYYEKMLFHKQLLFEVEYQYSSKYNRNGNKYDFSCGLGLFNKSDLRIDYSYSSDDDSYNISNNSWMMEVVDTKLIRENIEVKYRLRTFKYDANVIANWKNDSKYDVRFGKLLDRFLWDIEFKYNLREVYVNDLDGNVIVTAYDFKLSTFSIDFKLGLGKNSSLNLQGTFFEYESDFEAYGNVTKQLSAGINKRMYSKYNFYILIDYNTQKLKSNYSHINASIEFLL